MAKGGSNKNKLTKIKSVLKKMQPFRLGGRAAAPSSAVSAVEDHRLHAVYVGKSRRRYLVTSEVLENPLFKELVESDDGAMSIGCEVVMFEHMLWMMENGFTEQPDSLDELVQYYAW